MIALFPGSFDPVTSGHINIVQRIFPLFDKLYVGIGEHSEKKYMFGLEQRRKWLEDSVSDLPNVKVVAYQGLTVEYCKQISAKYIVRGIRGASDFEYERGIALLNRELGESVETLFLPASPELSHLSATLVRDLLRHGGEPDGLIPDVVLKSITKAAEDQRKGS